MLGLDLIWMMRRNNPVIFPFGNHKKLANLLGIVLGVKDALDGIVNAVQCPSVISIKV